MADRVRIYEVGPRDGLQNEARAIPVAEKLALIEALAATGLDRIEIGSFVSPKWVPQMAGTDEIVAAVPRVAGLRYGLLVPNVTGFERYLAAVPEGFDGEIAVFVSATEGFSRANLNASIDESFERVGDVVARAVEVGVPVRGYVSCVVRCPFDGDVAPGQVASVVERLRELAPMEVSLGDTIGAGVPETVGAMLEAVLDVAPAEVLAGHFHDTGGRALANIEVSLEAGLRVFDAAVGGLGGCPYAPGAPGNVATEAVVARLAELGFETGVDEDLLAEAAALARRIKMGVVA
ncbi:hydroxymethylglutaryl-CoA lyase [Aestuariibius sp. 2305UL40-4]|uniref:hydroxymethylglutaryl-CoA lyase n=1 Tax=Aestuariibius violaceus TaxID=3234132 RepID=UPI00345EC96E